jgi:predicted dinucleotide-binding enzyme
LTTANHRVNIVLSNINPLTAKVKEFLVKVAIIGAGNVGTALAGAAVRAGHDVAITAQSAESARKSALQTGARAVSDTREVTRDAELVILAIPYAAIDGVLADVGDALAGKIVVDVTNPVAPDLASRLTEGTSAAAEIAAQIPTAHVFKAFNTLFASRMADPKVDGTTVDGFVAGPDGDAKQQLIDFIASLGFRPIDAGPLPLAAALEDLALLNIGLNARQGWAWQSGWKLVGPTSSKAA